MKRKTFLFLVLPLILFGAVFFLRDQILVMGTKVCLNQTFQKTHSYQKISASKGKVTIEGLKVQHPQMALFLEKAELQISFKEAMTHPKSFINLWRKGFSSWKGTCNILKHYGEGLSIQNGVFQFNDHWYDFHFKSGDKKSEIGALSIHELLELKFLNLEHELVAQLVVENGSSEKLVNLVAFAAPEYLSGLEIAKGQIELKASGVFKKNGKLSKFATRFAIDNFEAQYPKLKIGAQAKKLAGVISYPQAKEDQPLWKRMECKVLLEKGNLLWDDKLALLNLGGNLTLDPQKDPTLVLNGKLTGEGRPLNLELKGRGALQESSTYWLELGLNLNNAEGTACEALLSVCRPEANNLVVQLEASNLLPTQVEMVKDYFAKSYPRLNEWEVKQGTVGGKLVALFEKGDLSHLEIENLSGKNITLASSSTEEPLHFSSIKGEGRVLDTLNFEIVLPAAQLFSFISPELKEMYETYRAEDTARLSMTMKFKSKEVETTAHIDFIQLSQALQFGYKSPTALPDSWEEISEGWVHCEQITHMLYGPFIKYVQEDLNLYGKIDLAATYDGKKIDCSLQVGEFLAKHPLLDLKAASIGEKGKNQGRAKLTYEVATNSLSGTFPLRQAEGYERTYGLLFQNVTGDLTLSSTGLKGRVANTDVSYDGQPLLKKGRFDFSYGEEHSLSNFFAQVDLQSTKEYFISASKFDSSSIDFRLLQGKEELARFIGNKETLWKGLLTSKPLKDKYYIQFGYDPRRDLALLDASGDGIHLLCKKQGTEYSLEELKTEDFSLKGTFSKGENGFNLSNFELTQSEAIMRGSGTFLIDLPEGEHDFGIKGDLLVGLEMKAPFPIQLKTPSSFKAAYSPDLGVVISDVNFAGVGCQFHIGQLQYLNSKDKLNANQCTFKVSEEFLNTAFETKALPAILHDLKLCKTLSGEGNYSLEKGKILLNGRLLNEKGAIGFAVEWEDQEGELSLSRDEIDEKLTFHFYEENGEYRLSALKGTFQGVTADLKQGKEHLKGQVTFDFAAAKGLIDLPLNRYLDLWKVGGKYQFDGAFTPNKKLSDWSFKGKVKAKEFSAGGYHFNAIEAKIEFEPGKISIENLDVTDDAGKLWLGEGVAMRSSQNGEWYFSFPTLEIRSFQPSALSQVEPSESSASPLIIKSALFQNLRGKIDDLKSLTATGSCRFTNVPKKGERTLPKRLPIQHLQKMGLDGALFIPASGEIEYTIENGKCYLRGLKSVFADKRRAEFLAPRNASMGFIDFDGNFALDLLVRQNVVRTITSPLTMQVRGKWDDPQFFISK